MGTSLEGQAVLAAAQREGGAQAGVGAAVGAAAGGAVGAGQQVKVAAGVQRSFFAGAQVGADSSEVAFSFGFVTVGHNGEVVAGGKRGALGNGLAAGAVGLAFALTDGAADGDGTDRGGAGAGGAGASCDTLVGAVDRGCGVQCSQAGHAV